MLGNAKILLQKIWWMNIYFSFGFGNICEEIWRKNIVLDLG
jgi:hypothetical protein